MSDKTVTLKDFMLEKIEYEDFSILDKEKVGKIISNAPTLIGRIDLRIGSLEQERFRLHQEYKQEVARKRLDAKKLKGDDKLTNERDREAWVTIQPTVIELLELEIDCVTKLKEARAEHEFWKNQFIAARKLETRINQEDELELQAARYKT